jgi:hypothetical protein
MTFCRQPIGVRRHRTHPKSAQNDLNGLYFCQPQRQEFLATRHTHGPDGTCPLVFGHNPKTNLQRQSFR